MKLLLFSDVHHDLPAARRLVEMSAGVDVVIGAGDFAVVHKGLEETIDVLTGIAAPTVVVPGNNETHEALRVACAAWPAAHVCHGEAVALLETPFFGLGGGIPPTPWDWSFDVEEPAAEQMLAGCPSEGVLVVHSPPRGHLDGTGDRHLGSQAILDAVTEKRPRLVVCGHIHDCWEQEVTLGSTRIVNPGPQGRIVEL